MCIVSSRMFQTVIHVMKANIGTGMLALPRAISLAGLWTGTIGLIFICVFCVQCMHFIVESAQRLCIKLERSDMSYADVAEFAFSTSSNTTLKKCSPFVRYVCLQINLSLCNSCVTKNCFILFFGFFGL